MKKHRLGPPLIGADAVARRATEIADQIAADHQRRDAQLVIVGVLYGSYVFLADLTRELSKHKMDIRIDFIQLSSYGPGTASNGSVMLEHDLRLPVAGQSVVLVDDIFDTGLTIDFAVRHLRERGAASVKTCVLLAKDVPHKVNLRIDYVGFNIPNVFVVGYGLDFDHRYRELPYITHVVIE